MAMLLWGGAWVIGQGRGAFLPHFTFEETGVGEGRDLAVSTWHQALSKIQLWKWGLGGGSCRHSPGSFPRIQP